MSTFLISFNSESSKLTIGFNPNKPATNEKLVQDAMQEIENIKDEIMGPILRISGPASLPIAFVLAHTVNHLVGAVAIFDPKLAKYVVAVSHNPDFAVGDLID